MVCTDKSSVYYCNSRSSPARSPAAWWWTYVRTLGQSFYCARVGADVRGGRGGGVGGRLTLLWKVRSVIFFFPFFGRTTAGRFVVSVLSLHEQRTGWSSRHRASVEGRRAVYNNNTVPMTSRDWQPPQPLAKVFSHQQHAIFGKWLHHWGSTAACGRRDFRRDFSICSPEPGQWICWDQSPLWCLSFVGIFRTFKCSPAVRVYLKHCVWPSDGMQAWADILIITKEALSSFPHSTNRGRPRCPGFIKINLNCDWI